MADSDFVATILGIPHIPSIIQINVRSGPGTNQELIFKTPLGVKTQVQAVQPDAEGKALDGKIYQWFQLLFPDQRVGWVRDDLIEVEGNGEAFGYGFSATGVQADQLTRRVQESVTVSEGGTQPGGHSTIVQPVETEPVETIPVETGTEPAITSGQATALSMAKTGVNMRSGPSTRYNPPITRVPYLAQMDVLGAKPEEGGGSPFKWVNVRYQGRNGWIREDFLRYAGDFESFGVGFNDAYPAPMEDCWWIRDFNLDSNFAVVHHGWDFGANVGEPMIAGPNGGTVLNTVRCTRCTASRPSVVDQGLSLNDPNVLNSAEWGFGYGNYIVVRYLSDQLPESTRNTLANKNMPGAHLFVLYGHLNSIEVAAGDILTPKHRIGTNGNTGNSTGPHLHLEVRAWNNANETSWARMRPNLMNPVILFRR